MKNILVLLGLLAAIATPASAELKYTLHMSVKAVELPAAQANNAVIGMMGQAIKQMLPSGGADMIYTMGEKGARVEYLQAAMGHAEGSISLSLPDGTLVLLNPKDQTYSKLVPPAGSSLMQGKTTVEPTGQFETVAGVKCEVMAFDFKVDLPIPAGARAGLPPDFPTSIAMTGDTCVVKDQFQRYAELSRKGAMAGMLAAIGLEKLIQDGLVVRQNMRIAGMEMTTVVTSIGEEEVPASAFEIPAGYKEVPAPSGMPR